MAILADTKITTNPWGFADVVEKFRWDADNYFDINGEPVLITTDFKVAESARTAAFEKHSKPGTSWGYPGYTKGSRAVIKHLKPELDQFLFGSPNEQGYAYF